MARRRKRDVLTMTLVGCAIGVWLIAGAFAIRGRPSSEGSVASATPLASQASSWPPTPKPSASGEGVLVEDVNACVAALFPEKSFKEPPSFEFVCTEADPVKGSVDVKTALVKGAAGATSPAMREWVQLAWYEMVGYAVIRAHCCAKPPAFHWSFDLACPVDKPLKRFEKAARAKDLEAIDKVMFDYAEEIRCLSRFGQAPNFNQGAPPGRGMETVTKLLERAGIRKPD